MQRNEGRTHAHDWGRRVMRLVGGCIFRARRFLLVLALLATLTGCGGGSEKGTEPTANEPPKIATVTDQTVVTPNELIVEIGATDPDGPPPLTLFAAGLPSGASFLDNQNGTGIFHWRPTKEDAAAGPVVVTFNAVDGAGAVASETMSVTVVVGNHPPVFLPVPDLTVVAQEELSFEIKASDPDGPPPLTLSVAGLPDGAQFVDHSDGTGTFNWEPTNLDTVSSPFRVTFTATDGKSATATKVVSITVEPNRPPTLSPLDDLWVPVGEPFSFEVSATDPDGPPPLKISASGLPPGAIFSDNQDGTGNFSWTPTVDDISSSPHSVKFTATDGNEPGLTDEATIDLHLSLTEDFDHAAENWGFVDDIPTRPGSWSVIGGELRQVNNVERRQVSFDGSFHLGTFAYLLTGMTLTDYRVSVDVVSRAPERANDVGVMFRYQDAGNYYRLSANGAYGFVRLEKKVAGVFSPLAVNGRGAIHGQPMHIAVETNGTWIQVWINNEPVFAVEDNELSVGTVALYTQDEASFDNVVITGPAVDPSLTISTPLAYSVNASGPVVARGIAPKVPAGAEVQFLLGSLPPETDDDPPFEVAYTSVPPGDYTLEAILRDQDGRELARDTNEQVGVGGEYLVALGDSITNGVGDGFSRDNRSLNGRLLAIQGYQATLVDLLDQSLQRPTIVYNAGFSSDRSFHAVYRRVDSVLERHPGSNRTLVMLGTNDAGSAIPSGSGCSGSGCEGTFKGNMTTLVEKLQAAGKTVHVALIPPVFGNSFFDDPSPDPLTLTLNQRIQEYNDVIRNELKDIHQGPDFFSFFLTGSTNRVSLFSDPLHPNALGHRMIAHLWHNSLNPLSSVPLPFKLEELNGSTVPPYLKQNLLEVGNRFYVDRIYTLTNIPDTLADGVWVSTANDERDDTSAEAVSFKVAQSVRVHIGYDAAANRLPTWMSEFTRTGLTINTTNPQARTLSVYRRDYPAGTIRLGGNMAAGAEGARANYVVIVQPQ